MRAYRGWILAVLVVAGTVLAPASPFAWDPRTESNSHDYQNFGTVTFE